MKSLLVEAHAELARCIAGYLGQEHYTGEVLLRQCRHSGQRTPRGGAGRVAR